MGGRGGLATWLVFVFRKEEERVNKNKEQGGKINEKMDEGVHMIAHFCTYALSWILMCVCYYLIECARQLRACVCARAA